MGFVTEFRVLKALGSEGFTLCRMRSLKHSGVAKPTVPTVGPAVLTPDAAWSAKITLG